MRCVKQRWDWLKMWIFSVVNTSLSLLSDLNKYRKGRPVSIRFFPRRGVFLMEFSSCLSLLSSLRILDEKYSVRSTGPPAIMAIWESFTPPGRVSTPDTFSMSFSSTIISDVCPWSNWWTMYWRTVAWLIAEFLLKKSPVNEARSIYKDMSFRKTKHLMVTYFEANLKYWYHLLWLVPYVGLPGLLAEGKRVYRVP